MMNSLTDPEVTFCGTTFHIGKLLPMESHDLFIRHVRPLLRGAMAADTAGEDSEWKVMLAAFTDAPADHYYAIQTALWQHITYRRADSAEPALPLARDHANAFRDLEGLHIALLNGRAFAVNFRGWWDVLCSEFPQAPLIFQSLLPSTSTPSSPTPSTPASAD